MAASLEGCGCGLILLVGLVVLMVPLLPYLLGFVVVLLVLALPLVALAALLERQTDGKLRAIAGAATLRFGGDICRIGDRHGQIGRFRLEPPPQKATAGRLALSLHLQMLEAGASADPQGATRLEVVEERRVLVLLPTQLTSLSSMGAFGRLLEAQGITVVPDLAMEARATRAALQCARERDWAVASLGRLREMIEATRATLAKAAGNELLEPSIPQLRQALSTFEGERQKLHLHRREAEAMLRKLHDFLTVPQEIRPILHFDLDDLFDPGRLEALQASFEEVVTLNDSYRELSRERLV